MRTVTICGVLEYRFSGVEIELPDSIDIEDDDAISDYVEQTIDGETIRQHINTEMTCEVEDYDVEESAEK